MRLGLFLLFLAHQPVNLDNLMNKGIVFAIHRFRNRIPNFPIDQRPVVIGKRKPTYNTIDKVMHRLDRVVKVPEEMGHIVLNVHRDFLLNLLHVYNSLLFYS